MQLNISKRMTAIAHLIPRCNSIVDVGSDHAYLPIYCIKHGVCDRAVAGELNQKPFRQSSINIRQHGLDANIQVSLGDGLTVIQPGEVEGAVIAGMGGGTILGILGRSPEVMRSLKFMVLQPQGDEDTLRRNLQANGWYFADETLVRENDIVYQVMLVKQGKCHPLSKWDAMFGPVNWNRRTSLLRELVANRCDKLRRIIGQLRNSDKTEARLRLNQFNEELVFLEKELRQWEK